jgi:hypothetical protein
VEAGGGVTSKNRKHPNAKALRHAPVAPLWGEDQDATASLRAAVAAVQRALGGAAHAPTCASILAAGASVPLPNPKCSTAPGVRVRQCKVARCCRGPTTLRESPIPTRVSTRGSFGLVPSPPPRFEHPSSVE